MIRSMNTGAHMAHALLSLTLWFSHPIFPGLFTAELLPNGEFEDVRQTIPYGRRCLGGAPQRRVGLPHPPRTMNAECSTQVADQGGEGAGDLAYGDKCNRGVKMKDRSDGASYRRNDFEMKPSHGSDNPRHRHATTVI